jgi:hypothetical protein
MQSIDAFRTNIHAPLRAIASSAVLLSPRASPSLHRMRSRCRCTVKAFDPQSIYFFESAILSAAKNPNAAQISIAAA